MDQIWTIRKLIQWTTEFFTEKGIPSPRLDAELLLASALSCQRLELYLSPDRPVDGSERQLYRQYIKRRAAREPVAYILQKKEFWSKEFITKPGVLIPRPETEQILEIVNSHFEKSELYTFADLGTGSGVIAVTLALEYDNARVIAVDKSKDALKVAEENAEKHNVQDKIIFRESNWFDVFKNIIPQSSLDLIVSNPPYIKEDEIINLEPEIRLFEPVCALSGGKSGVEAYFNIVATAGIWLKKNGMLIVEMGCDQGEEIKKIFIDSGFDSINVIEDYTGRPRFVSGKKA